MLFINGVVLLLFIGLNMSVMQSYGPYTGPNIALNKTASQYPKDYCSMGFCYEASLAVDGEAGDGKFGSRHCSHTNEQDLTSASLTINFGRSYYISGLELFNRQSEGYWDTGIGERLAGFKISQISGQSLYTDSRTDGMPYQISINWTDPPYINGIRVEIPHRSTGYTILTVCELKVYSAWCRAIYAPFNGKADIDENTGEIIGNKITAGAVIHVSCTEGFNLIGPSNLQCLASGSYAVNSSCSDCPVWNETPHVCQQITCTFPLTLPNGYYSMSDSCTATSSGNLPFSCVIQPQCNAGYYLNHDGQRTCEISGHWSLPEPECSIKTCKVPNTNDGKYLFVNGSEILQSIVKYNESIQLYCNNGYKLQNGGPRRCTSNADWTGDESVCEMVKCKHPGTGSVLNGSYSFESGDVYLSGFAEFSETIHVVCSKGYVLKSGSVSRTCQLNGFWNGTDAECTIVTCQPLVSTEMVRYTFSSFPNGSLEALPYGSSVKVSCFNGPLLSGSPTRRCTENATWDGLPPTCEEKASALPSAIIGGAVGAGAFVVVAVVVIVIVVVFKRRKYEANTNRKPQYTDLQANQFDSSTTNNAEYMTPEVANTDQETTDNVYLNSQCVQSDHAYYSFDEAMPKTAIPVNRLSDLILSGKDATDRFAKEFETLPKGMQDRHSEAMKSHNRGKNRYKSLYAYDSSRVVLEKNSEAESDYINASFVHGFQKTNAYIASQGPTKEILIDFWRMVWQTKCDKIVMLTNLVEQDKPKCEQYWPGEGSICYGHVSVTMTEVDVYSDFVMRKFTIQKDTLPVRTVSQFHFTSWPDKGVPKYASSLVQFRNKVKCDESPSEGPIVVHCSAGVGRTGTFIALDYLTDQAKAMDYVNVIGCVETLRRQRVNLVQTLEQYIFVHHALVETLMLSTSALPSSKFQNAYRNLLEIDKTTKKRKLDQEFEMLRKLSPVAADDQYSSAKDVRNRDKNRYSNILPVEEFMPRLMTGDSKHLKYLNAVFLPNYKEKRAFVITQTPLETTIDDFWKLVCEYEIHTIVMMNHITEMKENEIYWPGEKETVEFGNIKISKDNTTTERHHTVVTVTASSNSKDRKIKLLQCGSWKSDTSLPESPEVLLSLLELVQSWQQHTGNKTILVHCMNGAEKSGLFCVVSAVIDRMKIEQDVAISHTIEEMRNAREQIIPSVEQYKFCHEVVLAYIQINETYSNFTI